MYSHFQLAIKYLQYYCTAKNSHGHGMHSPFVYDLITHVFNDKREYYCYNEIERLRTELKKDNTPLTIEDFGAGSRINTHTTRSVSSIAKSALKPKKFGQLFFRLAEYFKPDTIVELGTSLGLSTAYFASASTSTSVYTFEGAKQVAQKAKENFKHLGLNNIQLIEGNFDHTLPSALNTIHKIDLAYVDGNHRKQPTLQYFEQLLEKSDENTVLIFDDIHWSREMEEAWDSIKQHKNVTTTIDLFFIGLVFFRKENKVPQHFSVRF